MATFWPRCGARITLLLDPRGRKIDLKRDRFTIDVIPRTANVKRNGYHEADTWTLEFDARLLPFDPDQIKQAEVRIYMWDSQGDDSPGKNWAIDRYEMIRGLSDDDEGVLVGEDNSVKLTGRDYTGVLIDVDWDPKQKVPAGVPIDQLVQTIADGAAPPGTASRFKVVYDAQLAKTKSGGLVGKKRTTKGKGEWIKPGKNYWDVIYDICISSGYIVYVSTQSVAGGPLQPVIVITDPQTQTKLSLRRAPRLVYGKHLTKLSFKRKFGREKTPQQVLVTYDPKTKKEIQVIYPEVRNQVVTVFDTAIAVKKDEQEFVPAPKGIFDLDTLREYAKLRFYYRGRAETTYTFETVHLSLPRKDEQDAGVDVLGESFDMLRLQPGDALGVKFDPFTREILRAMTSVGERAEHLRSLGYKQQVANVIANNLQTLTAFEQPYYFNEGEYDFDVDDGLTIKCSAVNFSNAIREEQLAAQSDAVSGAA